MLQDFLPRYNARFAVQPEHPEPAYRPADPDLCLPETLCFKDTRRVARDNTVTYNWRVLQLLPDQERTSYAGLRVEVLERPDGELIVRYDGRRVATRNHRRAWARCGRRQPPGLRGPNSDAWSAAWGITTSVGQNSAVWPPWNRCVRSSLPSQTRRRQGRRCEGHRQQGIEPVDAYADANPVGPVEGNPEGRAERAVSTGHLT